MRKDGITTYDFAAPAETRRTVRIPTVTRPGDLADVDIVVLAVKNYGLEAVGQAGARRARRSADHRVAGERHRQPAHPAEALQQGDLRRSRLQRPPRRAGGRRLPGQGAVADRHPRQHARRRTRDGALDSRARLSDRDRRPDAGCRAHQDRDQSHQRARCAGGTRLAAAVGPRRLSAASVADVMGGRAHRARRRLPRAPHSRPSVVCPSWAWWRGFPAGSRGRCFGAGCGR